MSKQFLGSGSLGPVWRVILLPGRLMVGPVAMISLLLHDGLEGSMVAGL